MTYTGIERSNDYERRAADQEALRLANAERLARLVKQGVQVNLLPQLVDMLVDAVLPVGSEARLAFLEAWEARVGATLDDVEAQVRRQTLLAR